jgi:hypothetical protein
VQTGIANMTKSLVDRKNMLLSINQQAPPVLKMVGSGWHTIAHQELLA